MHIAILLLLHPEKIWGILERQTLAFLNCPHVVAAAAAATVTQDWWLWVANRASTSKNQAQQGESTQLSIIYNVGIAMP